jgi:hypothetical protein
MPTYTALSTGCGLNAVRDDDGYGRAYAWRWHRNALGVGKSGPRTGLRENFFVVAWLCGRTYDTK